MSRSGLWSKKAWEDANNAASPVVARQGTGQGLDKHLPSRSQPRDRRMGGRRHEAAHRPRRRARVTGMGGGYGRMRQMMQQGAARHGMPFSHARRPRSGSRSAATRTRTTRSSITAR